MKTYVERLIESAQTRKSLVCFGMDPVLENIPTLGDTISSRISDFFARIFEAFDREGTWPSAVKPNIAFYAQYGKQGLMALENVCELARQASLPIILDAKRGDIGTTSAAYAREAFEAWGADAVTVSPYMGTDSVMPFVEKARALGKGVYVLARTSNSGARDFQEALVDGTPLYQWVSRQIAQWGEDAKGAVGAVIGATAPAELAELHRFLASQNHPIPYLIPGVGSQGGKASDVMNILRQHPEHVGIHRINSSSGISYAFSKKGTSDFALAAASALRELNEEIHFE